MGSPDIIACRTRTAEGRTVIGRRYLKGVLLWEGRSASYYKATCQDTGDDYTMKTVKTKLKEEIDIHRNLKHPNILEYKRIVWDEDNVHILLEPVSTAQSLADFIYNKPVCEDEARMYATEILDATSYLHSHQIIHGYLNLENVFLGIDGNLKVCDVGLAKTLAKDRNRVLVEDNRFINYAAPEIVRRDGNSYDHKVDIWSLGVILYVLLTGRLPFYGARRDAESTRQRILANRYSFPALIKLSDNAKGLIRRLLNKEPQRRPSLESVRSDPFFCPPPSEPSTPPSPPPKPTQPQDPAPAPAPAPSPAPSSARELQCHLEEYQRRNSELQWMLGQALRENSELQRMLDEALKEKSELQRQLDEAPGNKADELHAQLPGAKGAIEEEVTRGEDLEGQVETVPGANVQFAKVEMALHDERRRSHQETSIFTKQTLRDHFEQYRAEKEALQRRFGEGEVESAVTAVTGAATLAASNEEEEEAQLEYSSDEEDDEEEGEEELETLRGEMIETAEYVHKTFPVSFPPTQGRRHHPNFRIL